MGGTVKKQNANLPGNPASVAPLQTPPPEEPRSQGSGWLNPEIARQSRPREIWPLASDRRAFFPCHGRALAYGMEACGFLRLALAPPWEPDQGCGEGRVLSQVGEERDRGC